MAFMDFCVLGLLMLFPHSLYNLKLAFSKSLSLFYSSSLGSIRVSVNKLLEQGLIEVHERSHMGRAKVTYRITAAGRAYFLEQFTAPIPAGRLEETVLARYHFLGLVEREKRVETLRFLIAAIEASLAELQTLKASLDEMSIPPEWQEVAHYQIATADYGIQAHQSGLAWFKKQLEREVRLLKKPKAKPGYPLRY
jgi:DNA-binding PadR family transcriptional regulator